MEWIPEASDLDVSSHNFNQKALWDEIKSEGAATYVNFSGKKKALIKPVWERAMDIVCKCLECKITSVDEVTQENITTLHAIVSGYKCD